MLVLAAFSALAVGSEGDEHVLRAAVTAEPTDGKGHHMLGLYLLDRGRAEEAVPSLRRATVLSPQEPQVWYDYGRAVGQLGDHPTSLYAHWRALRLDPTHGPTLAATKETPTGVLAVTAAFVLSSLDCDRLALEAAQQALASKDVAQQDQAAVRGLVGELLVNTGMIDEGVALLGAAAAHAEDPGNMLVGAGYTALQVRRYSAALDLFDQALEDTPRSKEAMVGRLSCLIGLGRYGEVQAYLVSSEPDFLASEDPQVKQLLAQIWRCPELVDLLDTERTKDAPRARALEVLAKAALLGDDAPRSAAYARMLLGALPADVEPDERASADLQRAKALIRMGAYGRAADVMEPYCAGDAAKSVLSAYGLAAWRGGEYARVTELLADRYKQHPSVSSGLSLAKALLRLGRFEEADAVITSLAEMASGGEVDARSAVQRVRRLVRESRPGTPAALPDSVTTRSFSVRVAADEEYRWRVDWDDEIRDLFSRITPVFPDQTGIAFELAGFTAWDSRDNASDLHELLDEVMAEAPRGRQDLLVVFTAQDVSQATEAEDRCRGVASNIPGYAIIQDRWTDAVGPSDRAVVLAHELAHCFLAVHSDEPGTLMQTVYRGIPTFSLDEGNARLLQATRVADFDRWGASLAAVVLPAAAPPVDPMERALFAVRDRIASEPADLAAQIELAVLLLQDGRRDQAESECRRLLPLVTAHLTADLSLDLGQLLLRLGRPEEARRFLQDGPPIDTMWNAPWTLIERGRYLLLAGDDSLGGLALARAIQAEPMDPWTHHKAARAYLDAGRLGAALDHAQMAVRLDPACAPHHECLADVRAAREEWHAAIAAAEEAVGLADAGVGPRETLADVLRRAGLRREAESRVRACLDVEPYHAPALATLGLVLLEGGRPASALKRLDQAVEVDPMLSRAHVGRGDALAELERPDEATDAYARARCLSLPGTEWYGRAEEGLRRCAAMSMPAP
jgi:tetratricopeptide (TPR) repeat protein